MTDPTGNRRFLVCKLASIDWNYSRKIDIHQVWSEAHHLYQTGYSRRLNRDETDLQRRINDSYRVPSYVLDLFFKFFNFTTNESDPRYNDWMWGVDILRDLDAHGLTGNQTANAMRLSTGLRELGVETEKRRGGIHYRGVFKLQPP